MCITEHWCNHDNIALQNLEGFELSSFYCRENYGHGGVAIYNAETLNRPKSMCCNGFEVTQFCVEKHFEICAVKISMQDLIIMTLYRTPDGNLDIFFHQLETVLVFARRHAKNVMLYGDFNIEARGVDPVTTRFHNTLRTVGFYCSNFKPTRKEACIDNLITNIWPDNFVLKVHNLPLSDHNGTLVTEVFLDKSTCIEESSNITSFSTRSGLYSISKINEFIDSLESVDWLKVLQNKKADDMFNSFMNVFIYWMDIIFPVKTIKSNKYNNKKANKNWYTPELELKKKLVMALHDKYLCTNHQEDYTFYVCARKEYRNALSEAKKSANAKAIFDAANTNKAVWKVVKGELGSISTSVPAPSAEKFSEHYSTTIKEVRRNIPPVAEDAMSLLPNQHPQNVKFSWSDVSSEEVIKAVSKIKPSKSKDIFDISNFLLKHVIYVIALPLSLCVNACIKEGNFPSMLKVAKVVPIFKKGPKDVAESYRPISVVPIFSKVFESLFKIQISKFFEVNNLFFSHQYGFRPGMSTIDAVEQLVSAITAGFNDRSVTTTAICDLSKAFDCVDHDILLKKLSFYGVIGNEIKFLRSFLSNRQQKVFVNGEFSSTVDVLYGVPQGSVLGPFLFLVMVNDLHFNIFSSTIMFADDVTFFSTDPSEINLNIFMNFVMEQARLWYSANKFLLNSTKTQMIKFTQKNNVYNSVDNVNILGIHFDPKLSWNCHIDVICRKLARIIYVIRHLRNLIPKQFLRNIYFALFHSVLCYGILFWGNASGINRVLLLQKQVLRIFTFSNYLDHCKPLFVQEQILTVINQYIFECLIHTKSNFNSLVLNNHVHTHNTRTKNLIHMKPNRLKVTLSSFEAMGVKLFNKMPLQAQTVSLSSFKKVVHDWLVMNPFYNINECINSNFSSMNFHVNILENDLV